MLQGVPIRTFPEADGREIVTLVWGRLIILNLLLELCEQPREFSIDFLEKGTILGAGIKGTPRILEGLKLNVDMMQSSLGVVKVEEFDIHGQDPDLPLMLLYPLLISHHLLKESLGLFEVLALNKLHESVQD